MSDSRQSPFFSRPTPGSSSIEVPQQDYIEGQETAFPDPPEWRANSPLAGGDEGLPPARASAPEGTPSPKPGVAAPVGKTDGNGKAKRNRRASSNVGGKIYGMVEFVVALVLLASIGVLFMAFVYGRYEEYVSAGFWALGSSLTMALVLNVVGLFRS